MNTDKDLPVDMIIVEPTVIDGKHIEVGTVLKKVEAPLAMDLAGSGKARPATEELIKQYKEQKANQAAAEKAAKEAADKAQAEQAHANSDALAGVIANAIAAALKAQAPAPAPAA